MSYNVPTSQHVYLIISGVNALHSASQWTLVIIAAVCTCRYSQCGVRLHCWESFCGTRHTVVNEESLLWTPAPEFSTVTSC